MIISLIITTFMHVLMISLTFKVLFVKLFSLMLCLGLSVPEDIPRCSGSTLALLASFINSAHHKDISTLSLFVKISQPCLRFLKKTVKSSK